MKTALYSKYFSGYKYLISDMIFSEIKYQLDRVSGSNKDEIIQKYFHETSDILPYGYGVIDIDEYENYIFYE